MGGPRASTERQRAGGRMCANCHRELDPPYRPGGAFCNVCKPMHRVLADFTCQNGVWRVVYRELSMRPLPRMSRFLDPDKIRQMYASYGTRKMSEDRQAFEYGLSSGAGMVELELTPEQFAKLKLEREEPM